ncbi:MAG: fibronectin type III domain-containing protein, partial [Bacteroidota bacterium]
QDTISVSERINLKVNIADTAGMLTPYLRKLDTASVSDRINLKVNIADTASMLEPYLREPESLVNGDILFYNNNKWIRLPIGQEGQFLKVNTGIPTWVSVSTAPGPPTAVSATSASSQQATVSFTEPLNNGGTKITGYTVISNPGGVTATGSSSPLTVTGLTNGISYTFTVVATNAVGNSVASTASSAVIQVTVPTVITTAISSITVTGGSGGGNITNDGGASVSVRGVVWGTSGEPTVALSTKTSDGTGLGSFTSTLASLTGSTTYYVRAYATNSVGTAYGNEVSFITSAPFSCGTSSVSDIDGNTYTTVSIGTQCWMGVNLKTSRYRNGGSIPNVTDRTAWSNLFTGAWCNYGNITPNNDFYGKLYNFY